MRAPLSVPGGDCAGEGLHTDIQDAHHRPDQRQRPGEENVPAFNPKRPASGKHMAVIGIRRVEIGHRRSSSKNLPESESMAFRPSTPPDQLTETIRGTDVRPA